MLVRVHDLHKQETTKWYTHKVSKISCLEPYLYTQQHETECTHTNNIKNIQKL